MATSKILSKLNLAVKPVKGSVDPVTNRRNKLLARLAEQRALATADRAGETFEATKDKWIDDPVTGVKKKVRVPKRIKRWFFNFNGTQFLEVRYGNKPLELAKGKSAIEVGDLVQVPVVIDAVVEAVNTGELDTMLMAIRKPGTKAAG